MDPNAQLRQAMQQAGNLYAIDPDLVRPGAAQHGVQVTEGNLITPLSPGNYNARIPRGTDEEIQAVRTAKTIAFICEDYRQSAHAAEELNANVVFSTAGGVVQPEEKRRNAAVQLAAAMHAVNPRAKFVFAFHNEVCGGAKHFTDGQMAEIYNTQGPEAELSAMTNLGQQFVQEAIAAGVPPANIQLVVVKLHTDHGHAGHKNGHMVKEITPIPIHNA